jgi:type 1 fimbria pilin
MNFSLKRCSGLLALAASFQTDLALAVSECWIRPTTGPITFHLNVGAVYVPRDAAVGSVIGQLDRPFSTTTSEGRYVYCENDDSSILTFNARAVAPIFQGSLPPVEGEDVTGKIFETGIPGIGARIKLRHPFDGVAGDSFVPLTPPTVPFNARLTAATPVPLRITVLEGNVTLVKTGPIAPGPQTVDRTLFDSRFSMITKAFDFQLTGTVIQAQCDVSTVSDDPVKLGEWSTSAFTGPGYSTSPVNFNIVLSSCEVDPGDINVAWAYIRLDGVNGSMPIAGVEGGFTLTSNSTAKGIGIQVLRSDGITPVPLGREFPLMPISPGNTVLDLSARFYQTGDTRDIVAGDAKGSLSFTISFQ